MNNKEKIVNFCKSLGLDTLGVTSIRRLTELEENLIYRKNSGLENEFESSDIESRVNLESFLEGGKSIISIAFPYLFNDENTTNHIYFSKYTLGQDYHSVVINYLKQIGEYISQLGGNFKYFVDSNPLPERYIANLCGVGFIGKNNMLITKKYGSFVFLGEIITDLELEEDEKMPSKCGECDLCLKSCPTKSIKEGISNPNVCLSYITQKKHIEKEWFELFNGRMFGCDTCQIACPHNKEVIESNIKEFKPFTFMKNPNLEELIRLDNKTFKERYRLTSSGWRGKNIIIRNAMINTFVDGKLDQSLDKDISSPYLKDYYNRLLGL
ncbi:tRNA epoxyqueuosine(34) reductase QueG [uncultured Clostridium sp.]|uniref:tRNA epoxyqueuosine(34) reductase QueG n=1 Tax=uncultured Clostridium sp. TaxID=59620 RepID=UPI0028EF7BE0|nr:tRNA epoxyqueuosine(34) reductase QueG [uncultured Clostridium sp.]